MIGEIIDIKKSNENIKLILNIDNDYYNLDSKEQIEVILQIDEKFNIGDLLKFEKGNLDKFEKVPTENMDFSEFEALKRRIFKLSCEQLIATHKSLAGKVEKSGIYYYKYYMDSILDFDRGYTIPKSITPELHKFINSKYVSDYFKEMIKSKIIAKYGVINIDETSKNFNEIEFDSIHDAIAFNAISSNRECKDFSGQEFDSIYKVLQSIRNKNGKRDYSYAQILALVLNLDSQGAIDFLNNKLDFETVIKCILERSGLSSNPSYYSGRGARLGDLNGKNLIAIFNKLYKINPKNALAMVKMTFEMPTLGATEFINSLYTLAYNNYDLTKLDLNRDNIDLGNGNLDSKFIIGFASFVSSMGYHEDDTNAIKREFINLLPNEFKDKLDYKFEGDSDYHKYR